ncbi:hypothetical protein QA600_20915 [Natronococcus sp. A-GB1]|nr:hypothetical protein [Natronococcus sp. A-GB1]MDG5761787.1 hypothetical protein [Natronococcus sp. A-GB1]
MQTTAFEDYVTVATLSRLSYEFEDIDPEVSPSSMGLGCRDRR